MHVGEIINREFITFKPQTPLLKAGKVLESKGRGQALVFDEGKFRGVLSKDTFIGKSSLVFETPAEDLQVADVMEENLEYAGIGDDVFDVADKLLTQKSVLDLIPVKEEEQVVGYVSSKEYTKLFIEKYDNQFKVGQLMQYNPPTVESYVLLDKVIKELKTTGERKMLVLSGRNLVGIITLKDLSLALFSCSQKNTTHTCCELNAEDIMTRNLKTTTPNERAEYAAETMIQNRISCLPVQNPALEGMLTRKDFLKAFEIKG
ncbi:MAG: CBS domain-containing protein [Candidatus Altiarchaeales archaeon]|nr:CBS domain-containing protein [Candidatus Altiarchaeales archaeon]